MTRANVLLVAAVQSHIAQFHKPLLRMLKQKGVNVDIAAYDNLDSKDNLELDGSDGTFDVPFSRSPLSVRNVRAAFCLRSVLKSKKYSVVHCNTPMGGVVGRVVSLTLTPRPRVVYTAHGFHFFVGAPIRNWIAYFPAEWLLALCTDLLVTICDEDYRIAKRWLPTRVTRIHGVGADSNRFPASSSLSVESIRSGLGVPEGAPIILAVGELNRNKNQQLLIKALAELSHQNIFPHVVLAGNGPKEKELKELAGRLDVADRVHFVGYRSDVNVLMLAADLLVSSSLREGLGMNVVEAMTSGVPVVVSRNRGHRELVTHNVSGLIFDPHDPSDLATCLQRLLQSPKLRAEIARAARPIAHDYSDSSVSLELADIYEKFIGTKVDL